MEKSEAQSDNSSDNATTGTEKSTSDTVATENVAKSNKVSDTKPTERDSHGGIKNKGDTENNTDYDSDASKDEDVSFKPEVLAVAAAEVAVQIFQSKSEVDSGPHKLQSMDVMQDDMRRDVAKLRNNEATIKIVSDELKKGGEIRPRGMGADDEDSLVIDEAEDYETKSESDIAGGSELSGGENGDEKEFEPTIDMMMNDFDDERTMEEEEACESQEDEANELSALEQEQDMPLEELLKLYNYGGGAPPSPPQAIARGKEKGKKKKKKHKEPSRSAKREQDSSATEAAPDTPLKEESKNGSEESSDKVNDKEAHKDLASSSGINQPLSDDDDDNEQEEDDLDEDDEDEEDEDEENSSNRPEDRHGIQLQSRVRQNSTSDPSSPPAKKNRSELARFYEAAVKGRSLRSSAPGGIGQDDDDDDSDGGVGGYGMGEDSDDGRDYSWKKTIMIGPSFQASVPGGLSSYGDTLPYENDDKLLWNPHLLSEQDSEEYLAKSQHDNLQGSNCVANLPLGAHIRDDEQALFLLLQCGYNCEEGLRRRRMNAIPPADTMSLWSEEECRAFELGLRLYGKDFHMIQQQKVRTRSVGELVQFYYLWKKTERHDVFANATRLEKKKYTLHPGTTDYMDRFIDETDSARDRSSSPNFHSLLASYGAENKRGISIIPGTNHKQQMLDTTFANGTSANIVDLTCNASEHIGNTGISESTNNSSNGGSRFSTLPLSITSSSITNTSPVQNISTPALSGTISSTSSTAVNTNARLTRTSEETGITESTSSKTVEQEST